MTLYLSHQSALRYWLTKTGDEVVPDGVSDRNLAFATASMKEVKGAGLPPRLFSKASPPSFGPR